MSKDASTSTSSSVTRKSFHFLAGLFSGLASSILLQPADLLKTRLQQQSHHIKSTTPSTAPPYGTAAPKSSSPLLSTLRSIASSPSPIRQLWRGTLPSAIRTGAGSALYFGGLDWLRSAILTRPGFGVVVPSSPDNSSNKLTSTTNKPRLTNTANLLTGAFARAAAGFVMMPITVIKVRYESSLYSYTSLSSAARDILSTSGWKGFFAGFGATAVRDAPYAGIYVLFYEAGKRQLHSLSSSSSSVSSPLDGASPNKTSASINFTSGTVAAAAATALTNPFDAIKTRLQLYPAKYHHTYAAARTMLAEEGWRAMFDGLALRMVRKGMSSALAWTVYEELVRRAEVEWFVDDDEGVKRRVTV